MPTYNTIAILQNGQVKTSVQPGTPVQLYADFSSWDIWTLHTQYTVKDAAGNIVLQEYVGINVVSGVSYLDWVAPATPGTYTFYPDSADLSNKKTFTVSTNGGGGGGGSGFELNTTTLLLLAAAVVLIGTRGK